MRTFFLTLLLASACNAGTTYRNDANFRWEIGENFNFRLASDQQDGSGIVKSTRVGQTPQGAGPLTEFWSLETVAIRDLPRRWAREFEPAPIDQVARGFAGLASLSLTTPRHSFDLGELTTIVLSEGRNLQTFNRGWVTLHRVGDVEYQGRLYPDYQPVAWGETLPVPEPSIAMHLITIAICMILIPPIYRWATRRA